MLHQGTDNFTSILRIVQLILDDPVKRTLSVSDVSHADLEPDIAVIWVIFKTFSYEISVIKHSARGPPNYDI